ncbi:MAG: hypothetical protein KAJ12_05205 [Bacteroidetes bacterium]|nr:hypothetical protein [Bacteroidota bacterium]
MSQRHDRQTETDHIHQRLRVLYVLAVRGIKEKNLGPMVAHADEMARERFTSGNDLWEVQATLNVLEEIIWRRIVRELPPAQYAEALGLVATVLAEGKSAVARRYVALASKARVPSLDLRSLFTGAERF